jgi:Fic family protein
MKHPFHNSPTPVGQLALVEQLGLKQPAPAVQSFIAPSARKTEVTEGVVSELYPPQWTPEPSPLGHLKFALKHEAYDLRIIHAALQAIGPKTLQDWIHSEPTGSYARRAWFLYEQFSDQTLDIQPLKMGNYTPLLNPKQHFVSQAVRIPRQRILDNLLGGPNLCPTVRRTSKLQRMIGANLKRQAQALTEQYDPVTLSRAIQFLYTKETRSSYAIEGETPSPGRTERFIQTLKRAADFDPNNKAQITQLQGSIVDPRYAASDWRDFQNFVGEATRRYGEYIHFICPKPEDVPALMEGWMTLNQRLYTLPDPVVAAAVSAFAFVFIHPFEDGNGRIHRFMVHHFLARLGFSPPGLIFPVSAAIVRDVRSYDLALESFSRPLFDHINWDLTAQQTLVVHNPTRDLYRFFDATAQAEYLYERVADTIRVDLKEELDFLKIYDAALAAIREVVDMPDRKASLLVRLLMQNGGRLSGAKRNQFAELTDGEVARMETAIGRIIETAKEANPDSTESGS